MEVIRGIEIKVQDGFYKMNSLDEFKGISFSDLKETSFYSTEIEKLRKFKENKKIIENWMKLFKGN